MLKRVTFLVLAAGICGQWPGTKNEMVKWLPFGVMKSIQVTHRRLALSSKCKPKSSKLPTKSCQKSTLEEPKPILWPKYAVDPPSEEKAKPEPKPHSQKPTSTRGLEHESATIPRLYVDYDDDDDYDRNPLVKMSTRPLFAKSQEIPDIVLKPGQEIQPDIEPHTQTGCNTGTKITTNASPSPHTRSWFIPGKDIQPDAKTQSDKGIQPGQITQPSVDPHTHTGFNTGTKTTTNTSPPPRTRSWYIPGQDTQSDAKTQSDKGIQPGQDTQPVIQPTRDIEIQPGQDTQPVIEPTRDIEIQPGQDTQPVIEPTRDIEIQPGQHTQPVIEPTRDIEIQPGQDTQPVTEPTRDIEIQPGQDTQPFIEPTRDTIEI